MRPAHFGDPVAELEHALGSCALADASDLTRLVAGGPDYLTLLQRLSTGDVAGLKPDEGKPTILTTPKGRIVERLYVHHLGATGVLSVCGSGAGPRVLEHIRRFSFAEDTGLEDATGRTFQLVLVGPKAADVMAQCGLERPEPFHARAASVDAVDVHVLAQDGFSSNGFSVVGPLESVAAVRQTLLAAVTRAGGGVAGSSAIEARRVLLGLPAPGHELTEEHNPLEAGQWDAVSFDKGCYVGQEVVARLRTYDKVSTALVGLELDASGDLPTPETALYDENRPVGRLTSAVDAPGRPAPIGLGFVKKKALREGLIVSLGSADGPAARVVDLPFA